MPKLPKHELLKSTKRIGLLFSQGKSLSCYPIRAKYRISQDQGPSLKVAFTAPKRQFGRAVDRNKVKRRLRESYRLNKEIYYQSESHLALEVMFIITSTSIESYSKIESAMKDLLSRLSKLKPDRL